MQNETNQPVQKQPQSEKPQEVNQFASEIARLKESMNRAKSETSVELARLKAEAEELDQNCRQRSRKLPLWAMVALLTAGLIGATSYGYRVLEEHGNLLTQMPALEKSLGSVGQRMDAAEEKMQTWASQWETVGTRLGKLEKRVSGNLSLARKYAQEQAAQTYARLLGELDNRTEWIQARLNRIESDQAADRVRLAQLQEEIGDVRRDMTRQIAQVRHDNQREVADLDQRLTWNERDLDVLARQHDRQRVDFELAKNQPRELARGLSMTLRKTDVSYQRVEGWVQLVPDGRTLWIRGQGIQQPLTFYTQQDSRPHELVFTRVTRDAVLGYLLIPNQPVPVASQPAATPSLPEPVAALLPALADAPVVP